MFLIHHELDHPDHNHTPTQTPLVTQSVLVKRVKTSNCGEKDSDSQWSTAVPHQMLYCPQPVAAAVCAKGPDKKQGTCYLFYLFLKVWFPDCGFWRNNPGWSTSPENIPNCLWSITLLITNRLLHSAALLSPIPDLSVIYLALFTVHLDCMLWQINKVSSVWRVWTRGWMDLSKHQKTKWMSIVWFAEGPKGGDVYSNMNSGTLLKCFSSLL